MPSVRLTTYDIHSLPVVRPSGGTLAVPLVRFTCLVRLPGGSVWDAVVDTGSPLTWLPECLWSRLRPGVDFEWLPFAPGFLPPVARTAGWGFAFRLARFLTPLTLLDGRTAVSRDGVLAQFADGNPPVAADSKRPPFLVLGLWGGLLEGSALHTSRDPATDAPTARLEF